VVLNGGIKYRKRMAFSEYQKYSIVFDIPKMPQAFLIEQDPYLQSFL